MVRGKSIILVEKYAVVVITTNLYIRTRFMKSWVYICPPWSTKYGSVQSTSHYFNCLFFIPSPIIFPHFTHAFSIAKLSPVVIWSLTVPLYGNSLTWKARTPTVNWYRNLEFWKEKLLITQNGVTKKTVGETWPTLDRCTTLDRSNNNGR